MVYDVFSPRLMIINDVDIEASACACRPNRCNFVGADYDS